MDGDCACEPDCAGKACGDSGCGDSFGCGTCGADQTCSDGQCLVNEIDLSGWTIDQTGSAQSFTIADGTVVPAGTIVVIGRDADQAAFEDFWAPLPAAAVYINSGNSAPKINGGETIAVSDAAGAVLDGPTFAIAFGTSNQLIALGPASDAANFEILSADAATPGTSAVAPSEGVRITEVSDALGADNFIYEFVELYVASVPDLP